MLHLLADMIYAPAPSVLGLLEYILYILVIIALIVLVVWVIKRLL